MIPDASWPALPAYQKHFTPEQHAAHRSPKGIARPEDLIPGTGVTTTKAAKGLLKVVRKLKLTTKTPRHKVRKKKRN